MSDSRNSDQRLSESDPQEHDLPERAGHAARLLAEEGLEEGPLLGALEALERLGRTAPPAPSGELAKLLSGTRPQAPAETTLPGGEPGNDPGGTVVPLARGRKRRAAASGTIAAFVLVAGLGGAAAASPALRGQLERAISAVVPVAVAPGSVEVDRAQLGSVPSPASAVPSSPPSEPIDEPAEETGAKEHAQAGEKTGGKAGKQGNDAGSTGCAAGTDCGDAAADNADGKRSTQEARGASEERRADKRDGSAGGQGNGKQGSGSRGSSNRDKGDRNSGKDYGNQRDGRGSGDRDKGNGNGQGGRGGGNWQVSGAWDGNGKWDGNGWVEDLIPVRGSDLWDGLGANTGRWSDGSFGDRSGLGGR